MDIENGKEIKNEKSTKSKKKKIKVQSDAFPKNGFGESLKLPALAEIHRVVSENNYQFKLADLTFHGLVLDDYQELACLHKEWFPVNYTKFFYERIFKQKLDNLDILTNTSKKEEDLSEEQKKLIISESQVESLGLYVTIAGKEYLIGSICCEIKDEIDFSYNCHVDLVYRSELDYVDILSKPYCFAYIMTIGIVYEARKLNLGSLLLEKMQEQIVYKYPRCAAFYLHVIDHNTSAIKFYEKNGFVQQRIMPNYYHIDDKVYSSIVFYRFIKEKPDNRVVTKLLKALLTPIYVISYLFSFCGCYLCRKLNRTKKVLKLQ